MAYMDLNFIIADDHPLFRGALRQILQDGFRPDTVTEADCFKQLQEITEDADDIDLLFLDLTMPRASDAWLAKCRRPVRRES